MGMTLTWTRPVGSVATVLHSWSRPVIAPSNRQTEPGSPPPNN